MDRSGRTCMFQPFRGRTVVDSLGNREYNDAKKVVATGSPYLEAGTLFFNMSHALLSLTNLFPNATGLCWITR